MKKTLFIFLLFSLTLFLVGLWFFLSPVVIGENKDSHTLKIKRGLSFVAIQNLMQKQGIIKNSYKIAIVSRILGYRDRIKAGEYILSGGLSSYALLKKLVAGKVTQKLVTIPEGKTARQIASILAKKIEIDSARFVSLVTDSVLSKQLGMTTSSLEGFLFPNSYNLHWGMTEEKVIRIMVDEFQKQVDEEVRYRAEQFGFTLVQALTLASIIEGESVVDSEREMISAVYHNRLKKRMLLQADPTIQYVIRDGPRRLLKSDLKIDSPYNTYLHPGLPPGPINNPGLASIKASVNPAGGDNLYFVANGDGSHTFSRTLREHLRAKAKFDRYRKQVKQQRQKGDKNGTE